MGDVDAHDLFADLLSRIKARLHVFEREMIYRLKDILIRKTGLMSLFVIALVKSLVFSGEYHAVVVLKSVGHTDDKAVPAAIRSVKGIVCIALLLSDAAAPDRDRWDLGAVYRRRQIDVIRLV